MSKKNLKQLALLGLTSGLMITAESEVKASETGNVFSSLSEHEHLLARSYADETDASSWLRSGANKNTGHNHDHGGKGGCGNGGCGGKKEDGGKGSCGNGGCGGKHDKDHSSNWGTQGETDTFTNDYNTNIFHPFGKPKNRSVSAATTPMNRYHRSNTQSNDGFNTRQSDDYSRYSNQRSSDDQNTRHSWGQPQGSEQMSERDFVRDLDPTTRSIFQSLSSENRKFALQIANNEYNGTFVDAITAVKIAALKENRRR